MDFESVRSKLEVRRLRTCSPTGRTKLQIKGQFFAYIMRNIDRREREVSNEGMKLLLESSENTAFQATFLSEEATFLRALMVGIASINAHNCSLGWEFFFSGQGAIFS